MDRPNHDVTEPLQDTGNVEITFLVHATRLTLAAAIRQLFAIASPSTHSNPDERIHQNS